MDEQEKTSWDSPGAEEIEKVLENVGVGEETEAVPAQPEAEKPEEKPAPEAPETPGEEKPKSEGEGAEEGSKPAQEPVEAAPRLFNVDGVVYTEAELSDLIRKGPLRQADYTRKTQALADRQRELDAREARLLAQAREAAGDDGRGKATPSELDALLDDPDVPDAVAKALRLTYNENKKLRGEIDQREQQARQDAVIDRGLSTFEATFSDLCKKHGVTDPLERKLLHSDILAENPDIEDLDALRASVERLFEHTHKGLVQRAEKIRKQAATEAISGLTKLPVTPSTKGGGAVSPKPAPKPTPTLDDGSAAAEFADRLDRLRGVGA